MRSSELTPADAAFREELRDWLAEHLVGEFRAARGVGGPADDRGWNVRLAWEKELKADLDKPPVLLGVNEEQVSVLTRPDGTDQLTLVLRGSP